MSVLSGILVAVSLLLALFGFVMLTQATNGVGAVALGCFFGILARIAQASAHHQEQLKRLDSRAASTPTA